MLNRQHKQTHKDKKEKATLPKHSKDYVVDESRKISVSFSEDGEYPIHLYYKKPLKKLLNLSQPS